MQETVFHQTGVPEKSSYTCTVLTCLSGGSHCSFSCRFTSRFRAFITSLTDFQSQKAPVAYCFKPFVGLSKERLPYQVSFEISDKIVFNRREQNNELGAGCIKHTHVSG